ncbi:hypothetical protein F0U44_10630 [Nocardioides humilatus]|uniref:Lipoprotein n=1 Tax=Nocardioides humilatus TaxID=2607660 RepID=A0A5B1LDW8_9ACTN|nr:hypothetical protein [Nocardioides humilatus]KAA1418923.1 hypothetical protein F0U44_10630 [Nocardioides humilatus]
MKTRLLSLIPVALLAATTLTACGSDDKSAHGNDVAGGPSEPSFTFTKDLGCGFGFAKVDDEGENLLSIYHDFDGPKVDSTVTFPDKGWTATVTVGTHLDANWCNDVIEDPQAEVAETWEIVEGTLVFEGEVPTFEFDGSGNDQPVRAQLTNAIVENEDGEQVELGDIALTNTSFGFLAG